MATNYLNHSSTKKEHEVSQYMNQYIININNNMQNDASSMKQGQNIGLNFSKAVQLRKKLFFNPTSIPFIIQNNKEAKGDEKKLVPHIDQRALKYLMSSRHLNSSEVCRLTKTVSLDNSNIHDYKTERKTKKSLSRMFRNSSLNNCTQLNNQKSLNRISLKKVKENSSENNLPQNLIECFNPKTSLSQKFLKNLMKQRSSISDKSTQMQDSNNDPVAHKRNNRIVHTEIKKNATISSSQCQYEKDEICSDRKRVSSLLQSNSINSMTKIYMKQKTTNNSSTSDILTSNHIVVEYSSNVYQSGKKLLYNLNKKITLKQHKIRNKENLSKKALLSKLPVIKEKVTLESYEYKVPSLFSYSRTIHLIDDEDNFQFTEEFADELNEIMISKANTLLPYSIGDYLIKQYLQINQIYLSDIILDNEKRNYEKGLYFIGKKSSCQVNSFLPTHKLIQYDYLNVLFLQKLILQDSNVQQQKEEIDESLNISFERKQPKRCKTQKPNTRLTPVFYENKEINILKQSQFFVCVRKADQKRILGDINQEATPLLIEDVDYLLRNVKTKDGKDDPDILELLNAYIFNLLLRFNQASKETSFINYHLKYSKYFNIDTQNINKDTLLILAVKQETSKVVEYLLSKGANPNVQNKYYNTALHYAISHKMFLLVNILNSYGAKDNIVNITNRTAWDCIGRSCEKNE